MDWRWCKRQPVAVCSCIRAPAASMGSRAIPSSWPPPSPARASRSTLPSGCSTRRSSPPSSATWRSHPSPPPGGRTIMAIQTAVNVSLDEALREAEARFSAANPKSAAQYQAATGSMPGGNTRSVLYYTPFPVTIARAEGATLEDIDGHRYTDFLGEYTAGLYGHSHPVILEAIREALDGGLVFGGPNRHEPELARLLCERFPSLDLVRFTNSGTEANLMALATARAATGRERILAFQGGYHGGVLSFAYGVSSPINAPFPCVLAPFNDEAATLALIERHARELAAIIVEPVVGGGGGIPGTRPFLETLRQAAARHGIVLI